ncbi:DUF1499 domain-containing protein [Sulfitobacter sp. F26169L]|uniref:DUF1499 domain-containing protein n=1 Tax=Sulfitobacter sp. F26169L TaxID=2996015 RepID=UPI003A4C5BEE
MDRQQTHRNDCPACKNHWRIGYRTAAVGATTGAVVTPQDNGSRVDMRSVSRVGRSDQGVNAGRISDFQEEFRN